METEGLMNKQHLCDELECSMFTLNRYLRAGMPYRVKGGRGVAWLFDPDECWDWLQNYKTNPPDEIHGLLTSYNAGICIAFAQHLNPKKYRDASALLPEVQTFQKENQDYQDLSRVIAALIREHAEI